MITTYEVKQKTIELENLNDKIVLWFFGDVHRDTDSCDVERWKWFLKKAKEDENAYFIGMGDYHDFASTREKKALNREMHETTIKKFDDIAIRENKALMQEIGFIKGRTLGLVEGNHNWFSLNGKSSTEDLADRLEADYLGWLCHYTLTLKFPKLNKSTSLHFVLCHGKAGGKTFGATLNQVGDLKAIFPIADIYCMGHDHQRAALPVSVLVPTHGNGVYSIKQKRQFLCRSGAFKKAYCPGEHTYEVGRLFKPADLGALRMTIGVHREEKKGTDRLITDIEATI